MAEPLTHSNVRQGRADAAPRIAPIEAADLPEVAAFLVRHFGAKRSLEQWRRAITSTWCPEADHGYLLRAGDGRIGGVIVLFRARRRIGGAWRRTCGLGSPAAARMIRARTSGSSAPGFSPQAWQERACIAIQRTRGTGSSISRVSAGRVVASPNWSSACARLKPIS